MKFITKVLAALVLLAVVATPAAAQGTASSGLLVSAGVSFLRVEGETAPGFKVDVAKQVSPMSNGGFDVVGELSFNSFGEDSFDFSLLMVGAGGRVSFSPTGSPADFFGQVTIGIARASEEGFSSTDPYVAPGFGVRFNVNDSTSVFGQIDFPILMGDFDNQSSQRYTFGVVFNVGQ